MKLVKFLRDMVDGRFDPYEAPQGFSIVGSDCTVAELDNNIIFYGYLPDHITPGIDFAFYIDRMAMKAAIRIGRITEWADLLDYGMTKKDETNATSDFIAYRLILKGGEYLTVGYDDHEAECYFMTLAKKITTREIMLERAFRI